MQQQSPYSQRLMVESSPCKRARGDVNIVQEKLSLFDARKALAYVEISGANRFDLCAPELDTAFKSGKNVIAMTDETIVGCWGIIGTCTLISRGSKGSRRRKRGNGERERRLEG